MPPTPQKDWIQTFTGKQFRPLSPSPDSIDIRDIAHHLSMMCRYTGAVKRFYSVAEHSIWVSKLAPLKAPQAARYIAKWGLLHDASEAYISDVSRPVKHQPEMAPYRAIEKNLQNAIVREFGLYEVEPPAVKVADLEMLGTETAQLFDHIHPEWALTTATGSLPAPIPWIMGHTLGLSPVEAESAFLARYVELFDPLLNT